MSSCSGRLDGQQQGGQTLCFGFMIDDPGRCMQSRQYLAKGKGYGHYGGKTPILCVKSESQ